MASSLFDIFGDHLTRQMKNVSRQPLDNIENMGKSGKTLKSVSSGPVKPNEPLKKGDTKKSFLSNAGKALQSTTPARGVFTPRPVNVNVGSLIYNDDEPFNKGCLEEVEFTKPTYKYDNYHRDIMDYLPLPETKILEDLSPPNTPPPATKQPTMDFDCSYQDEFFTDDFSNSSMPDDDLGLPDLY